MGDVNIPLKQYERQNKIILKDAEESFDKIQYTFIRTLNKLGIERIFFNMIKAIYDKPTATLYSTLKKRKHFL